MNIPNGIRIMLPITKKIIEMENKDLAVFARSQRAAEIAPGPDELIF
jgi:hypothetical protein